MNEMDEQTLIDGLPKFLQPQFKRDKQMRLMSDPEYDPTTLYISQSDISSFTPTMQVYWELKIDNYDKILFFKLGKFYEMFYEDAIICQRVLDLNWMGGDKKYHVGFPEVALDRYVPRLIEAGYKVAVVEQMETPRQMERRHKSDKRMSTLDKKKGVLREICNIITRGTFLDD